MSDADNPPWAWPEPVWRGVVEEVRAGRSLKPASWPGGAPAAFALSFDADHETPALRDGNTSPGVLAAGEFGSRVAVPRILDLLARHEVPASFYVPAVSALLHPDDIRRFVAEGHEVGAHGWIHERNSLLAEADERDLVLRSLDTLERLAGRRPTGIRTPSWDFSPATLRILVEAGLRYDSSLMADDVPYELLSHGEPSGLVELPVEWVRDDAVYFGMARYSGLRPYTDPETVARIWRRELDGAVADGGVFQLTLHPSVSGHRSRSWIVEELLAAGRDAGVWFATHEQVVDHVLAVAP
ncbi:polysaccharide deacetylase family protein [Kineococcus rhizosphaerae]|uniref:Polysaccharide deacetylase n=1 Tax=Kineococcus rhizosphaerae TaxID=559628 RepID=A0A2T0R1D9_9ACTN|nr:polysaccharide deacetylase [Kineococcus rhizosphaerae]PRY13071.1 polysaccharide deacetylase [Kineococcus rhizosphaerae]